MKKVTIRNLVSSPLTVDGLLVAGKTTKTFDVEDDRFDIVLPQLIKAKSTNSITYETVSTHIVINNTDLVIGSGDLNWDIFDFVGTLTATRTVVLPAGQAFTKIVRNSTTGGFSISVIVNGGTGITIPNGKAATLFSDGTNMVNTSTVSNTDGIATVPIADANTTVTDAQFYNSVLSCTGALTANRNLVLPTTAGYSRIVVNNTTGGFNIRVRTSGGTKYVAIVPGASMVVYCDGTDILKGVISSLAPVVNAISPTIGAVFGGTAVTISGNFFTNGAALAVTIGGVPCTSVTFVSATTVTAITGAGTVGTVDVTVTNADEQTGTLANGFSYQLFSLIYTLDETTAPFQSTGNYTTQPLSINGGATPNVSGVFNQAVDFGDGTANKCLYSADTAIVPGNQSLSVECWVFIRSYRSSDSVIVYKNYRTTGASFTTPFTSFEIALIGGGNGTWRINATTAGGVRHALTAPVIELAAFHHIALRYNGTTLAAFLDGVLVASTPLALPIDFGNDGAYMIGGHVDSTGIGLDGIIDNVKIQQAQNDAYYAAQFAAKPFFEVPQIPDCKMWLRFDTGVTLNTGKVSVITDKSLHGNGLSNTNSSTQPPFVSSSANFNGQPTIAPTGTQYLFSHPTNTPATPNARLLLVGTAIPFSIFIVAKQTTDGNFSAFASGSTSNGTGYIKLQLLNGAQFKYERKAQTTAVLTNVVGGSTDVNKHFYGLIYTGTTVTFIQDGIVTGPIAMPSTASDIVNPDLLGICGNFNASINELMTGEMAEFVLFMRAITTTEAAQLRTYAQARYSLP